MDMYLNQKVKVPGSIPSILKNDLREIDDFYRQGDWVGFDCALETLEATVKQYRLIGRISQDQMNMIFKRYGLG